MNLDLIRKRVVEKTSQIRRQYHFTQAEFANLLGLSQQRYSEIERGKGSLRAEQLLFILQRFNVPLSDFSQSKLNDPILGLQNALIQWGAKHLKETNDVLVPEKYNDIHEVILETLLDDPGRLVAHLAPVIAKNYSRIKFRLLEKKFIELGYPNRFWWLLENIKQAIRNRLLVPNLKRDWKKTYRSASDILQRQYLGKGPSYFYYREKEDVLDPGIISPKTMEQIKNNQEDLSKKWKIVTRIRLADFEEALANTEAYD